MSSARDRISTSGPDADDQPNEVSAPSARICTHSRFELAYGLKLQRNGDYLHPWYDDGRDPGGRGRGPSGTTADDHHVYDIGIKRAGVHRRDAVYAERVRRLGTPYPKRSDP